MTTVKHLKAGDLIPAIFLGGPVGLLLPGVLMHVMPLGTALAAGGAAGLVSGLALILAIRKG